MAEPFWGNTEDFWTSDEDTENEEPVDANVAADRPQWLIDFEAEREKVDLTRVGVAEGFNTRDGLRSPACAVINEPEKPGRYIRKRWVIADCRDVSNYNELLPPESRALNHPFELDEFQKRSVLHLENREHVFVCAHTSAGKTVVAEYAIALAAKHKMRAIYTSPIKALSNQKFREFSAMFESVGIITGDVSVNTKAQCLIMTTEILRSLLYRGDPLLSQLEVVIFDEVHYVNDPDRGVVWEETIIMLPQSVTMVMLSATVPNYLQFAEWIGVTKAREVFAICTRYRPTPLRHYLWANDRAYLLLDERNQFNTSAYNLVYNDARAAQKAKEVRTAAKAKAKSNNRAPAYKPPAPKFQSADAKAKTEKMKLQKFVEFLVQKEGLPVVCFCFSRKRCEEFAHGLPNILQISQDVKSKVHVFVKQALSGLSADDRQLPQIQFVETLVNKGVGVHHGGLLPIIKEMVEILFSRGLIQVLFATETFAMGVNMPARSVLFTGIHKHDGRGNRALLASEYTQIAGRAGRRGLDACGNVYVFSPTDTPPNQAELSAMMLHKATPLHSKFRLTFSMLLQLLTRQGMKPLKMIASSFKESVRAQRVPLYTRDLGRRRHELAELPKINSVFGDEAVREYVSLELKYMRLGLSLHRTLWESKFAKEVFCLGRVVLLHSLPFCNVSCFGLLLGRTLSESTENPSPKPLAVRSLQENGLEYGSKTVDVDPLFTCLVLVPRGCSSAGNNVRIQDSYITPGEVIYKGKLKEVQASSATFESALAAFEAERGVHVPSTEFVVIKNVNLGCIGSLITEVVKFPASQWSAAGVVETNEDEIELPKHVLAAWASSGPTAEDKLLWTRVAQAFDDQLSLCGGKLTSFTTPKKMKQVEVAHVVDAAELRQICQAIINHRCHLDPRREENVGLELTRRRLEHEIKSIEFALSDQSLDLIPDMEGKLEVLRRRNFVNDNESIALKGRVACEVIATDEITLVEAMFEHMFNFQSPEVIAAAVSAFVFPETCQDEEMIFSPEFEDIKNQLTTLHLDIAIELRQSGIRVDLEDWCKLCNFQFAHVAFWWARGEPFTKLVKKTSLQEGTIVRTIVRLDEMVRKLKSVAHLIGNTQLKDAMQKTSELIHRDIVFASSLYLQ